MKRDIDLCRELLLGIEAHPDFHVGLSELKIEGRPVVEIRYHLEILHEAGLIWTRMGAAERQLGSDPEGRRQFAQYVRQMRGEDWYRLTWAGHEFLDAARSDTLWTRAKQTVAKSTGGLAFEFLKAVLVSEGKQLLGLDP